MYHIDAQAMELLIQNDVRMFPVCPTKLKVNDAKITICTYTKARQYIKTRCLEEYSKRHAGFTCLERGEYLILLDDNLGFAQRSKVIAHEIAHIHCGHISVGGIVGKAHELQKEREQEREAEHYAEVLLAPPILLLEMGVSTPQEVQAVTKCDTETAQRVWARMTEKRQLKVPRQSNVEIALCRQFETYVQGYRRAKQQVKRRKECRAAWLALFAALVVICMMAGLAATLSEHARFASQTQTVQAVPMEQSVDSEVCATASGTRYHLPTCHYVKNRSNVMRLTASQAATRGLLPCKICIPHGGGHLETEE